MDKKRARIIIENFSLTPGQQAKVAERFNFNTYEDLVDWANEPESNLKAYAQSDDPQWEIVGKHLARLAQEWMRTHSGATFTDAMWAALEANPLLSAIYMRGPWGRWDTTST